MKKIIICGIVGAVVAQIWGTISWMALPWHNMDYRSFKNDQRVARVLSQELQGSGIYLIPNYDQDNFSDEKKMESWNKRAQQGPFAFMSVKANGISPGMGGPMAIGFLTNVLIAVALFWFLRNSSFETDIQKTIFLAIAGGIGGLYPTISNWSWWNFPTVYSFSAVADLFITWGLAGFAMVKLNNKLK